MSAIGRSAIAVKQGAAALRLLSLEIRVKRRAPDDPEHREASVHTAVADSQWRAARAAWCYDRSAAYARRGQRADEGGRALWRSAYASIRDGSGDDVTTLSAFA